MSEVPSTHLGDNDLPVIDFGGFRNGSDAQRAEIGRQVDRACRDTGFFYIENHGIAASVLDTCFASAARFFALPEAEKQKISISQSRAHRGWYRLGEEVLNPETAPQGDQKEGIKIGRDCGPEHPRVKAGMALHGANQWPDLPDWRSHMEACYSACERLGRDLMRAMALGLGLDAAYFDRWLSEPMATLSPIFYPPTPHGAYGAGAHTDFGCLTILFQQHIGGLFVQNAAGEWHEAPPRDGCAIINIGDMLARWSNDQYRSTRHRVFNHATAARQSLAFFFDPDPDADLSPLPGCVVDHPHYPPMTALDHLLEKIDESFSYRQDALTALDTDS